jgi:hypothetical protein
MTHWISPRIAIGALCATLFASVLACSDATEPRLGSDAETTTLIAPSASATSKIVLKAWEDTRVGLPPLAITRADSIEAVIAFVRARSSGWIRTDSLPGNPLPAEFYEQNRVTQRFGIVDLEGDTGFFVTWQGSQALLRPATDAELLEFLGFFGIGVVVVE